MSESGLLYSLGVTTLVAFVFRLRGVAGRRGGHRRFPVGSGYDTNCCMEGQPMTDDIMNLCALVEKMPDAELLRGMASPMAQFKSMTVVLIAFPVSIRGSRRTEA
jgi:hypothetical protein